MLFLIAGCVFIGERQSAAPGQVGIYTGTTCDGETEYEPISCAGEPRGPQHRIQFTAPASDEYSLMTHDQDTVLQVFHQDGTELACNDDYADPPNFGSRVDVLLNKGQTVDIVVTSYLNCGEYRLDISPEPTESCPDAYAPNGSKSELALMPPNATLSLTHALDEDWFDARVPPNHRCYYYASEGTLFRTEERTGGVTVFDSPSVVAWAFGDEPYGFYLVAERRELEVCAPYTIDAICLECGVDDDYEPNDGYELAAPLTAGTYDLTIDSNDPDFFSVQLGTGQTLTASSNSFELEMIGIYDPSGAVLITDPDPLDGTSATVTAPVAGAYTVEVRGIDCGFYRLQIEVQ